DLPFRVCYHACAHGPFGASQPAPAGARDFATDDVVPVSPWENDGIVNTASMLWPGGETTRLVAGDHGDIIGHFTLVPPREGARSLAPAPGRQHASYDLLRSGSGFSAATFEAVWHEVFGFCAT
ncbi:MAG TPA: hypothetical protein VGQ83_22585, partial [Polyangia bacterium]